jgi:DNA-binding protein HU-beta
MDKEQANKDLVNLYIQNKNDINAYSNEIFNTKRDDAFKAFMQLDGIPGKSNEQYKYTNLAKVFTKGDLIALTGELDDIESKAAAARIVNFVLDVIVDKAVTGHTINIGGFVNMKQATQSAKPARPGRNPSTGAAIQIPAQPAKKVIRIKPAKAFKDAIAG